MQTATQQAAGLEGVRRAALEIAAKRAKKLETIKQSLLTGNDNLALAQMRDLVGIEPKGNGEGNEQKSNRTDPSIH
jgi:hypothetical protein